MKTGSDILNELRGLNSPLADMSRSMPYAVPEGYFEELAAYIPETVKASEIQEIPALWTKAMPYRIPEGYFETFPATINTIIAGEQKLPLYKEQKFEVPEGYFEQLPAQILKAAKASDNPVVAEPTRTIPLGKPVWKNIRWAAAAVLLLSIGFGSYKTFWSADSYNAEKALAGISKSTINEYVQQHIDEFDMESIENTVAAHTATSPMNTDAITDEDIILYLDEASWDQAEIN
jgi:hypothetical protein